MVVVPGKTLIFSFQQFTQQIVEPWLSKRTDVGNLLAVFYIERGPFKAMLRRSACSRGTRRLFGVSMRSGNPNLVKPDCQVLPVGLAQGRSLYEQEIAARHKRLSHAPALLEHSATRELLEEFVVKHLALQRISASRNIPNPGSIAACGPKLIIP
jgi:hypothetical protein